MAVVTIQDYSGPSNRAASRLCPTFRLPWDSMSTSYNVLVSSRAVMLRRATFILLQLLEFTCLLLSNSLHPTSLGDIPWTLTTILFFFFVAWNLHLIVSAQGVRVVLGRRVGRRAFDGFLGGLVVCYVGMIGCGVYKGQYEVLTMRVVVDLVIFVVAWITTWEADGGVILG